MIPPCRISSNVLCVARLHQLHDALLAITHKLQPQEEIGLTKVAHFEFGFHDDLKLLQHGGAVGGKDEIIHVDKDDHGIHSQLLV